MRRLLLTPGTVRGRLRAPPSKSYTHRALAVGHLAGHRYRIERPLDSDDTRATARAITALGTRVVRDPRGWTVGPGRGPGRGSPVRIDCGESGTTLRFAAALAVRAARPSILLGAGRLPIRPMDPLLRALTALGARVARPREGGGLPLRLEGPLHGGAVSLDASGSSQFASALLLVLPTLDEDSTVRLTGRVVSRPYLDATLRMLAAHHVHVDADASGRRYRVAGGQAYRGSRFRVPGDASSAAYFWVAAALTGGSARVDGVPAAWPQADLAVLELLRQAGARVRTHRDGATVTAGTLRAFSVDLTHAPDLFPLAGTLAAGIEGRSTLAGAGRLVAKESDRRAGTERLLRALGARVERRRDRLVVEGRPPFRPFALLGAGDHRMVMTAAVAARAAARGPCTVEDAGAVAKSYPGFWQDLERMTEGALER